MPRGRKGIVRRYVKNPDTFLDPPYAQNILTRSKLHVGAFSQCLTYRRLTHLRQNVPEGVTVLEYLCSLLDDAIIDEEEMSG